MQNLKRAVSVILIVTLLLSALPPTALASTDDGTFRLGTTAAEMLAGGGVSVLTQDGTYYSDAGMGGYLCCRLDGEITLLSTDCGKYLNYDDGLLYYAVQSEREFTVWSLDVASHEKRQLLQRSGTLARMYVVNGSELYYQCQKEIIRYAFETGEQTHLFAAAKLRSFVPTAFGLIYAIGELFDFSLYAGFTLLAEHADNYYIEKTLDGGTLVYSAQASDWQLPVADAFSDDSEAQPFTGFGTVDTDELLRNLNVPDEETDEQAQSETRAQLRSVQKPLTAGQQNIVKRAMQMTNIRWTPLADVPKWGGASYYTAGTTYTGLPYGQPVYASYVPWKTSLAKFSEYVQDTSSKFYTDQSTYNKTAPYYSCDCSAFVSWAWELPARQTTSYIANYATLVSSDSYATAQVGDCLNLPESHVVLLTDMNYNADGAISAVRVSECTPPLCKSTWYGAGYSRSLADFSEKYFGAGYKLYRSLTRESVTYSHVCAVPLEGDVCKQCGVGCDTKQGIDVSHWQETIDWKKASQQVEFAILRTAHGLSVLDSQWEANLRGCMENEVPFGVYLYGAATSVDEAVAEAQLVLERLGDCKPQLPVFYDFEDNDTIKTCSNAEILEIITAFCGVIEEAGLHAGVYANTNDWNHYLTSPEYDKWYRWVAQYYTYCQYTGSYCMWQYTSSGTVAGIQGNVDMDLWYGDFPHTHSYSAQVTIPATCTTDGVMTYTCSCGDCYTQPIAAAGHNFVLSGTQAASCITPASEAYVCIRCGQLRTDYPGTTFADWTTTQPEQGFYRSRTLSRFSDYGTVQSAQQSLSGYEQQGSLWVQTQTQSVKYVTEWPAGFDRTSAAFADYQNTPRTGSQTDTEKTVVDSDEVTGWLYWHWCRGNDTLDLGYDRKISPVYTQEFCAFDAFYSTTDPSTLTYNEAGGYYTNGNADCCGDTARYYALPVREQKISSYQLQYVYGAFGAWSEWSEESYTATDTRRVETQMQYSSAVDALYGAHSYTVTIQPPTQTQQGYSTHTCTVCGDTYTDSYVPAYGDGLRFTVFDGVAARGERVTLTVSAAENLGICHVALKVQYDTTKLRLVNSLDSGLLTGGAIGSDLSVTPYPMSWDNAGTNTTANGVLAELTFEVLADAQAGDTAISLSAQPTDVTDAQLQSVHFQTASGVLRVLAPGDVDGSGKVDSKDVTALRRYLAGGWGATVNENTADVNADGKINAKDITLLRRYLAGGWGIALK